MRGSNCSNLNVFDFTGEDAERQVALSEALGSELFSSPSAKPKRLTGKFVLLPETTPSAKENGSGRFSKLPNPEALFRAIKPQKPDSSASRGSLSHKKDSQDIHAWVDGDIPAEKSPFSIRFFAGLGAWAHTCAH